MNEQEREEAERHERRLADIHLAAIDTHAAAVAEHEQAILTAHERLQTAFGRHDTAERAHRAEPTTETAAAVEQAKVELDAAEAAALEAEGPVREAHQAMGEAMGHLHAHRKDYRQRIEQDLVGHGFVPPHGGWQGASTVFVGGGVYLSTVEEQLAAGVDLADIHPLQLRQYEASRRARGETT